MGVFTFGQRIELRLPKTTLFADLAPEAFLASG
jgi:hypothetical protein